MIPIHRRTRFDVTRRACRVGDGSIYVYGSIGDRTVASVSRVMKRVERFDGDEWQTSETRAYTYDAFGRTISQSGPLADVFRHRFSSKYFDIETGLYYYGYRFYHPVLMRWLTRDPIEERGGLNFYSFVNNNPFNIDKLGLAVIVLKHLPGENPPGGWMSSNHAALTVYNSPFYFVTPQTCSDGRLRFSVSIEPPNSFVHVYFRSANDVVWAMRYETDHIDIVRQYDEALYAFKRAVESIYDCPRPAREKWIAEERKLRKIRDKLRLENDSYDEEGGPHDLMEK